MGLTTGTRIGPYEIVSAIGAGGMGEVYQARDTRLDRDVAIKVLPELFASDPERLARFEREAKTLAAVNHSNIAQIYGVEESNGTRALVMELIEGETLADRIARGPMPIDEALPIAKQIAEALEAAHEQGIIHRDLKPANIKIRSDGTVKVLDFGLAKLADSAAAVTANRAALSMSPTITSPALMSGAGVLLGTAAYMSPEQAKGSVADKRSDIWALGCVLYEMLTGRRAFDGEDIAEVLGAVVRLEPDWNALSSIPAPLVTLIRTCLNKNRNARVADASTARYVIDQVSTSAPDAASPSSTGSRLAWSIAAFCLAALGVAATLVMRRAGTTTEVMPVQFDVTAPENSTLVGAVPQFALSPDGRLLAFVATSNGKPMLWVRSLATASAQPLPGTEGVTDPFWSPDSQWLGFFTAAQLKKVSAVGGPVIPLTDVTTAVGGTWSKDNVIVAAGGSDGLWRIAASGGAKTILSSVDKARGETGYRYPSVLPDGRHYLYLATRGSGREVRVASLDDAEVRTVLTDVSRTMYASGHLVFSRAGVLMAVAFDANTRQVTGEPFPIADRVSESTSAGYAPFSVSENGITSFAHAGADTIQLTWKDRSGVTMGTIGDAADYRDLSAFAPDGRVVLSRTTNNNRDVWVIDPARSTSARLTFGPATEANPAWSPDGASIAFSGGSAGDGLYEKSSDGSGDERLLAKLDGNGGVNDWSSDGRFIAYRADGAEAHPDVWIVPTDGKAKPFPLMKTQYDEDNATFSPDVRWIVYESDESGEKQIYLQPFPPTGAKYQISRNGGTRPRWRADGREIFFVAADASMMAVPVNVRRPYEAGTPVRLFDSGIAMQSGRARMYAVTPDGNRFLLAIPRQRSTPTPITVIVNWLEATRPRNTAR
jgi:serine/threonine protein kinase